MIKKVILSLGLSLLMVLLSGPQVPVAVAADRITLSGTNLTAFDWDTLVAQDGGFFAQENLEVNVTYMGPDLVIKALIAGTVDIAKSGTHFGIIAAARGADLKIIGTNIYGYPYDLISQPEFKSLADLKGRKIAGASLASITTVIFKDLMVRHGIPPSDYTLLFVGGSSERFQAVQSGQVAASLAESPPFNFRSVDSGKRVLLRYGEQVKDLQYVSYFTTPRFSVQNRSLVVRFLRAIAQSMRWLNNPINEREAVQILARRLKTDEAVAARTYKYMILENRAYRGEGTFDGRGLTEMIRLLAEYQMIPRQEPWESFVETSFLPAVKTGTEK